MQHLVKNYWMDKCNVELHRSHKLQKSLGELGFDRWRYLLELFPFQQYWPDFQLFLPLRLEIIQGTLLAISTDSKPTFFLSTISHSLALRVFTNLLMGRLFCSRIWPFRDFASFVIVQVLRSANVCYKQDFPEIILSWAFFLAEAVW